MLVSVEDVKKRPGFDGVPRAELESLVEDAIDLVSDYLGSSLDENNMPGTVRVVIVTMVRRAAHNPMGNTQETLGDYSYSGSSASVYMTKREKRLLRGAVGVASIRSAPVSTDLPRQYSDQYRTVGGEAS